MEMHIDESILLRYFSEDLTPSEMGRVEEWLAESEENRKVAEDIYYIYYAIETVATIKNIDRYAALKDVKKKIRYNKRATLFTWIQRIAAILFIPLLIGSIYNVIKKEPVRYMETRTSPGMISTIELPDGSKVWLNSGSYLKYPLFFEESKREVLLDGEAYFSIQKNEKKQFVVNTRDDIKVAVLGTEFNMDAYSSNSFVATTLVEGSVRLLYKNGIKEEGVSIKPGEKFIYAKTGQLIKNENAFIPEVIAWKENHIILRDTPLEEVIWILSKRFNVEFDLSVKTLKENSFTGTFDDQDLTLILEHLKISSKINYRFEKPDPLPGNEGVKLKVVLY